MLGEEGRERRGEMGSRVGGEKSAIKKKQNKILERLERFHLRGVKEEFKGKIRTECYDMT